MNKKFKIEYSIYAMGTFIALVGMLFLILRSDLVMKFRYFNEPDEYSVLSQEVEASQKLPVYLILTGPDQKILQDSLKKRMELMGKDVVTRPISTIESKEELTDYTGVVVATERLDLLQKTNTMLQFVKDGGSVFLAVRPAAGPSLSSLSQPLGLMDIGSLVKTSGIQLEQPFFNDSGDTAFSSESIINSSLSARLSDNVELFASSLSDIPLLWKASYGEGTFIVFNGTMFTELADQALFSKGIQQLTDHFIMPIINARVTELSGFPFLVPEGKDLSSSYTNRDYYRTVLWPELQRIESKYDLNYTASYRVPEEVTSSPRETSPLLDELELYSRDLLRMGGEIAVQESVATTDEQEVYSQENAILHIQEMLPGYLIRSAVSASLEAKLKLPEDITTLLLPNVNVEKIAKMNILPKTIEGFEIDDNKKWELLNEVISSGFYAHTINPYHFFEKGSAEEKLASFTDFQQVSHKQFPWIRSMTLSKAGEAAFAVIGSELYEKQEGDTLTFSATAMKEKTDSYYYFSTGRIIEETKNCEVKKIGKDLYLVEADELTFSIVLGGLS